jgi:hypothetical protein
VDRAAFFLTPGLPAAGTTLVAGKSSSTGRPRTSRSSKGRPPSSGSSGATEGPSRVRLGGVHDGDYTPPVKLGCRAWLGRLSPACAELSAKAEHRSPALRHSCRSVVPARTGRRRSLFPASRDRRLPARSGSIRVSVIQHAHSPATDLFLDTRIWSWPLRRWFRSWWPSQAAFATKSTSQI